MVMNKIYVVAAAVDMHSLISVLLRLHAGVAQQRRRYRGRWCNGGEVGSLRRQQSCRYTEVRAWDGERVMLVFLDDYAVKTATDL